MKYLILPLTLLALSLPSCNSTPSWLDEMNGCLAEREVKLLNISLKRFEEVLNKKSEGETLTDKYIHFLKDVERLNLLPEYYHDLLIKETIKTMLNTDFYEQMWQQSTQWVLNDGKGTPVYIINGFGNIPTCLAESANHAWFTQKMNTFKKPVNPVPSFLAKELLNQLKPEDYELPQIRAFIALSLCYQLGVAYYDK
ncbi:MAG: hypothetical protein AB8B53_04295 [Flavobacteriales bacterium]